MTRRTAMKSAVPGARSSRSSSSRFPRSGDSGSGSPTSVCSNREQQRKLESCEPAGENPRNQKKTSTKQTSTKHRPPPKFLRGLVRAVTDRSDVITFKDGSVTIRNHRVLVSEVLPVFFKASTSLKSFLRQLNYFAFKKTNGKGAKEPGVFHNETLKGKDAGAIIFLQRRQPGKPAEESTACHPSRVPRSASSSALARKAASMSATVAPVTCGPRAHMTNVPTPPTTRARSVYASSTIMPSPVMAIGALSGVAVLPTNAEIRGYTTSGPPALATGKSDCGIAVGNVWNSFDARGDIKTSDVSDKFPVPIAARGGSNTAHRSGSLDGNGGGGSGRSSDSDGHSKLGPVAAKRKVGEHFDGGLATKEGPLSKRGCRYLNRYCSNLTALGDNGSQGDVVNGGSGGGGGGSCVGEDRSAGEGASHQLPGLVEPGLVKTNLQQRLCAPVPVRAPHGVAGLAREDRASFAFGYDDGRVGGHATGTPPSSRRSIFCAVLPLDGSAWCEKPITPCPAPTAFVEPSSAGVQSKSGIQPEMAMATAAAAAAVVGRSPRTGRFLRGACSKPGFSTGSNLFPAPEDMGNTAAVIGRSTCMDSSIAGVGGGGGESCSWLGGNNICSLDSEEVFGSFFRAVDGDVSLDCLDECFMRERASSPPGQGGPPELGNGGSEVGVGLLYDHSC